MRSGARSNSRPARAAALLVCVSVCALHCAAQSFEDVTHASGIRFVTTDGASGRHLLPEFLGRGVALIDYDQDGDLDIYFPNGRNLLDTDAIDHPNALYRNDGEWQFTDVTEPAGVGHTGYGLGCAVGDIDNDGWPDLYVTNLGANVLYRNLGDGAFEDVTHEAGAAAPGFSTSCGFADIDNDGWLDLYIARYAEYDVASDTPCVRDSIGVYCHPHVYRGAADAVLRNRGDGRFEDVSASSGVASLLPSHGLGVVIGDVDDDGDVDIYVANDLDPNFLLLNEGDGTFVENAMLAGVAMSAVGKEEAGMGVAMADYDNDGDLDIAVTNFQSETYTLYRNDGDAIFTDITAVSRVGEATYAPLGWGVGLHDFDNDGWRDLFFANGHTQDHIQTFEPEVTYAQRNLLLMNAGDGTFVNGTDEAGPPFAERHPSRGAAFGDLDGDGDVDVVLTSRNGAPQLLRNAASSGRAWTRLVLRGVASNPSAIGARVEVSAGGRRHYGHVTGGGSFLSQSDLALHLGLGEAAGVDSVTVTWPSGLAETFRDLPVRRPIAVTEGQGASVVAGE
ncbi:CRTAC1 family protein [Candidatus Poribacteria bacterium]|nr:CRTAC1 family protein [Candidatus Poribacteria bacterium]MBT7100670.1 CRTAC1 family protein [Candidatus Poribacteria bacterium]